jgi:C4-dicarboxylate-specific signal transduction histidine kinase
MAMELSVSEARVGDEVVYSAIVRDVSEPRALERALDASRRETVEHARLADIGALTTRIAHDPGNPVAGLRMSAERILQLIARGPGEPLETVRAPAERIVDAARRLDGLVGVGSGSSSRRW